MTTALSPYTVPLIITGFIALFSLAYAIRQRRAEGGRDLIVLLCAIIFWIIAYIFELNGTTLANKLLWAKVQYFSIVIIPVAFLLFTLKYIGEFNRIKKPKQFTAVLLILPILTLVLVWTNEYHHLIWPTTTLLEENGLTYLILDHGIWFWIFIGYVYLLLAISTFILLRKVIIMPSQFRGQIILIVLGCLSPWLSNILYITNSNPFPHLDLTPFAFALTSFFFTTALFRFNFLDIVPIARERIVEQLEGGVIVLDFRNRVVDVNQTAASLLQNSKKILLGNLLTFNHPNWAPLEIALSNNEITTIELTLEQTFYEASITSLENRNEQANGRLITLHNITRRKQTELLLQQAKETAEAANQAKTHFLTNMSHEIRTPLNAVVGMTEMLRQTNLNTNQGEMVDVITQSSSTLVELIKNILDFARLEAGNLKTDHQAFDLIDCIEASMESVHQVASHKMIELTYHIEDQTPTLLAGDPVRLRQILANLIENGIKFSEEGSVHIEVSFIQKKTNLLLEFEVRDSGIGIAPEQISQLFLPFQQVDGSLTRSHGGNGLGLIICKRLVELMGGDIYLLSEVGKGTSVHFSVEMSVASDQDTPAVSLRKNNASLTGKRLLIIANAAVQRRQISKEARMAGLEVYVAGSSKEATYWIENSLPFDVVLLDTAVWQEDPAILAQLVNKETNIPLPAILIDQQAETLRQTMFNEPGMFAGTLTLPLNGPQMYDLLMNIFSVSSSKKSKRTPGESMADRNPLNILLVEDNQLNRRVIQNMLGKLGYEADIAVNGRIGVACAQKQFYDIILMDIQMPEMDGVAATKHILANCNGGKRPYIVAVTAHALAGDRENYLAAGMNQYVSKPVTINQLVEVLYQGIEFNDQPIEPLPQPSLQEEIVSDAEPLVSISVNPIDLEELERLVGEDTDEFLEMMAPIFLEDTANLMQSLEEAVKAHNGVAILHHAHTLKGTSASMGMVTLSTHARKLETMAKEGQIEGAPETLTLIQAEYQRANMALASFCATTV